MILIELFLAFFQVGLFAVGGGYAAMPLIQSQVVEGYGWLSMRAFTDLITIAEMTPGPIAINAATFVGIRIAGIPGAVVATMACILPSLLIVSLLAVLYQKYRQMRVFRGVLSCLRPAVVALIASAGLSILKLVILTEENAINFVGAALFLAAFASIRAFKWNPILVMLGCGGLRLALYLLVGV